MIVKQLDYCNNELYITEYGRVYLKDRFGYLKERPIEKGRVKLWYKTKLISVSVAFLVCKAFFEDFNDHSKIIHIDENKYNNRVENLMIDKGSYGTA